MVGAATKLQLPRGQPARQVSRAIQALARRARERIGHETLGGEAGPAQVAAGETGAADGQLALEACRQKLQSARNDMDASSRHRPADRHLGRIVPRPLEVAPRGDDGRLGGTVGVEQPAALPHPLAPDVEPGGLCLLAAENGQPHAGRPLEVLRRHPGHQLVPVGGGQVEHRDLQPLDLAQKALGGPRHGVVAQHQGGAAREAGVDLFGAGVEAHRGELQHAVPRADPGVLTGAGHVAHQRRVGDEHPFGAAGRAGGIDDVGAVVGDRLRRFGLTAFGGALDVQEHDLPARGRQQTRQALLGEQHAAPGVLEHEGQPLPRINRIKRQIDAAGLQHPQHAHHHLGRALDAEADDRLGADAQPAQPAGETFGTRCQLAVGEGDGAGLDGWGLRRARRLLLEQSVDAPAGRRCRRPRGPGQQLAALRGSDQRQLRHPDLEMGRKGCQDGPQVREKLAGRARVKAAQVIVDP